MISIAKHTDPNYYGFHLYKGAAFGNIMGQLYVYMGERSADTIKVWTRAKSEQNGDINWHKVTLTPSHKRWSEFDTITVSVDYSKTQKQVLSNIRREEDKKRRFIRERLEDERNSLNTLIDSMSGMGYVPTPNSKGSLYSAKRTNKKRTQANYAYVQPVKLTEFVSTEISVSKKGTVYYKNGK